jgi:hypothetical protein
LLISRTDRPPSGCRAACAVTSGLSVADRTIWAPGRRNDDSSLSAWYGANGVFSGGWHTVLSALQLPLESRP